MTLGKLIVIEGVCGSGKSTLSKEILEYIKSLGLECTYNHGACTHTDIGKVFKELTKTQPDLFSTSFYIADLIQNYLQHVKPLLEQGVIVVQDRYIHSITTYVKAKSRLELLDALDVSPVLDCYLNLQLLAPPDFSILCYAEITEIKKRLSERPSHRHKTYLTNLNLLEKIQDEFLETAKKEANYSTYNSTIYRSFRETRLKEELESFLGKNNLKVGG